MFNWFDHKLGIDLGTSNIRIYQKGRGIVLNEPSVVVQRKDNGSTEAVGKDAKEMIGRMPTHLDILHPIEDGVIANYDVTTLMLKYFLREIRGGQRWLKGTHVAVSVPTGITEVKKRAIQDAVQQAGASKITLIEEPLAAAMGANLAVNEPCGHLVVNIGGATTQAAIISLGGIVISNSIPKGGMTVDRSIVEWMKKRHGLAIGLPTAEDLKIQLGLAVMTGAEEYIEVKGRNLAHGLPQKINLQSMELQSLFDEYIHSIVEVIRLTIEKCPPELAGDVMQCGIVLCGGGALVGGLEHRLQAELGIPVCIAENPEQCVVLGTGKLLYSLPEKGFFKKNQVSNTTKDRNTIADQLGESAG
ncbi:rod shape-determining protein [Ammoniphilus sp. CFH 90114]|uniref:rod shape-determining protein n=1 Tax=Ammoniphilus sp. CFH 90114 TaxID=2493665 RepID=UPI00100FBD2A|nr:rod shape-determining protein [Ammoniphilus sp. CFH 90114]RXT06424.1 rod shape-determining protein [Ammoniphilus sp. CFH 90114]